VLLVKEHTVILLISLHLFHMDQSGTKWFAICMGLIGIIVGYGVATGMNSGSSFGEQAAAPTGQAQPSQPSQPSQPPSIDNVQPVDAKNDHIRGDANAQISIIEYSDFECPYCKRHNPTLDQLVEQYDGDVNVVFRHFPLSFHPNAQKAAEASECAAKQDGNDGFWGMHDLLYGQGLGMDKYEGYAEELGLDVAAFKSCLDSGETAAAIKADFDSGSQSGVNGTPGNIIYNNITKEAKLVSGAQPAANFSSVIDSLL